MTAGNRSLLKKLRRFWWRELDSNQRRVKLGRFTVCCNWPLCHPSGRLKNIPKFQKYVQFLSKKGTNKINTGQIQKEKMALRHSIPP